ncbi:Phosphoethanolamine transferase CptA [Massilia sp. Bi118]|uniref:phosphoethanolamine transferase n=1 Tax=Massilia sp. Bi118 TaxID=2822346 RepID=UPI001D82C996|nr:phosphoethanolamine transferase [Massilia sp. Bi118]CAH0157398.1 Phosphoethanolamine transferase CptA [Massilia sp. Bi118]
MESEKKILAGAAPALPRAIIRAVITILGLALYWQLGMQDLHSLAKAAAFSLIANAGLAGLQLLRCGRTLVAGLAMALNSLVLLNAAVEGFLFWLYGLAPKNIVVADALLGSNANEAREFIETYWLHLSLVTLLVAALIALLYWVERKLGRAAGEEALANRRDRWLGTGMLALFAALHLNATMAEENPLVYWPGYFMDYQQQRVFLAGVKRKVASDLAAAQAYAAAYVGPPRQTLVLVLGESVNRSNWSLYGYQRNTTPGLLARRGDMLVFRNVLSSDAATVQSLLKMLTPATLDSPDAWLTEPNVLALARTAGYRVTWLSNQEMGDGPIQIMAEHAHEQVFVNKGHGRAARSLDERLLPHLARVLGDPAPRKLVIVHMQGAHLRYDLRYPPAFDRFSGADDAVDDALDEAGRPYWIRTARNQYDNAMLYTDHVLSSILEKAGQAEPAGPVSVLYVSDHGQEVGHYRNFAGHSSTDPSGYQVPLLLWTNRRSQRQAPLPGIEGREYRTDHLDHTLLGLLGIQTHFYQPRHDILSPQFTRLDGSSGQP